MCQSLFSTQGQTQRPGDTKLNSKMKSRDRQLYGKKHSEVCASPCFSLFFIVCFVVVCQVCFADCQNTEKACTYIFGGGRGCFIVRDAPPEDYSSFRVKAESGIKKLLESASLSTRARVKGKDLEDTIAAVYDAGIIYPDLANLRLVEITKLFHESGFVKNLRHSKGEKGIGAVQIRTSREVLKILEKNANSLTEPQMKSLSRQTREILGKIKRHEINSGNVAEWLVRDVFFNILCSVCYDDINLKYFGGNVHLMLKAYQRGTSGTVETNYLSCIDHYHRIIAGEPVPKYVVTEEQKEML